MLAFRLAVGPGSQLEEGLSEKGVLQLLFDLRFLQDVLSSGKPAESFVPKADNPSAFSGHAAETGAAFEEIETFLQVQGASWHRFHIVTEYFTASNGHLYTYIGWSVAYDTSVGINGLAIYM